MSLPIADPWFSIETVDDGIVVLSEPHVARLWRANIFLVRGATRDLLVDTGMGVGDLRATLAGLTDHPVDIFSTHSHLDHIGGHREFPEAQIMVHPAEREGLQSPWPATGLAYDTLPATLRADLAASGFDVSGLMIDAVPHAGYDVAAHRFHGVAATRLVGEGDEIDLGTRRFRVLHLPGHSPGSVALWDEADGTLIAGDAVYDGILVDTLAESDIADYRRTMERLRSLPVRIVHGGHRGRFDRARLHAIVDDYLASRRDSVPPPPSFPPVGF